MQNIKKYILIASIGWAIFASFLYFENLVHYPKSFIDTFQMRSFYSCFKYEDDFYRKEEAMEYAIKHGHKAEAELHLALGLRFLKPVFWWPGFLMLIFFPIFFLYVLFFAVYRKKEKSCQQ